MIELGRAEFCKKLDEFSSRLGGRIEDFTKKGEFLSAHKELLDGLQRRNDQLRARVAEVEKQGGSWDLIKAEAARDYSSLFDDFLAFEERLDAEFMKQSTRS